MDRLGRRGRPLERRRPLRLDVAEFEEASADPARYREAVALHRGELLEALYDDWIVAPRERYCIISASE